MKKYIDLHMHSTASDGSYTPTQLVTMAKEKGLYAIAITDHDSVDGIEEAVKEGERLGVKVIPGVEIGVDFKPEMHILAYFRNDDYKRIEPFLLTLRDSRNQRNPKMIQRLQDLGYDITLEEVTREAAGRVVARPHFAKVLIEKGYEKNTNDVFNRILGFGKPGYVVKDKITPKEAIKEIIKRGGIPVLAHPILLKFSMKKLKDLLENTLVPAGLKGIEACYVDNSQTSTGNLLRMAIDLGLKVTGGSDFHGSSRPSVEIGTGRGNLKIEKDLIHKLFEDK